MPREARKCTKKPEKWEERQVEPREEIGRSGSLKGAGQEQRSEKKEREVSELRGKR